MCPDAAHQTRLCTRIQSRGRTLTLGALLRRLYRTSGHSLKKIAGDLGVTNTLRKWVHRAEAEGTPSNLLMQGEREELLRLRRENRVLKEEREILRKAAAFTSWCFALFAKETDR